MAEKQPTKSELQEENTILRQQNEALMDKFESLEKMVQDRTAELEGQIAESRANGEDIEPEVDEVKDPYAGQHPHIILADPPGYKLSWKNPDYRLKRGWRGWEPIEHDDEIGRELDKYLQDPPTKMEGGDLLDNKVRRGDCILCRLPIEIWDARQKAREQKDAARRKLASGSSNKQLAPGVTTFGKGQTPDPSATR
ncbi:MAG: hypothetical protein AMJ55_02995 [Gammaproteobacteria bacterium SG8_15]|nr:MAG: hypothetical protein AMJ55_02995 [Gammaproteobacteria bacterium SG8_15]